jgi:hypothetical protein
MTAVPKFTELCPVIAMYVVGQMPRSLERTFRIERTVRLFSVGRTNSRSKPSKRNSYQS